MLQYCHVDVIYFLYHKLFLMKRSAEQMARIQCNVISYILHRTVDMTIVLPTVTMPGCTKDAHHVYPHPYPVLYLLHGMGNNHQQWCGYTNLERYAEERQIAVVMISGENKFYLNWDKDLFYDFIETELPECVTNTFPISSRPEDTYIAGLSMGGFGALYHGLKNPEKFRAIGAFSAAVGVPELKEYNLSDIPLSPECCPALYITCGEDDFLYKNNQEFIRHLDENKIDYTWVSEPGYEHEWRFWDLAVERFLDWMPRTDPYKGTKRRI